MKGKINLDGKWQLAKKSASISSNEWIDATVPGHVQTTLSREGIVPTNLYYGKNLLKTKWVDNCTWRYKKEFPFKGKIRENVELVFDGLDTFAVVYFNGKRLGETDNMHLQYRFDVKSLIKRGKNEIVVDFLSTRKKVKRLYEKHPHYKALFYDGRNLVRKAQCQFGWDWAPETLSVGIWRNVYIENYDDTTIRDTYVETDLNGDLCFRVLLASEIIGKTLRVSLKDGKKIVSEEVVTNGYNNFINLKLKHPQLWWPREFGTPHIYEYTVQLKDGKKFLDSYHGTFGIRKAEIEEKIIESDRIGFTLKINGKAVFCKGANWVPADCFPGLVSVKTCQNLIKRAAEANFNMLRIWGGGIYEQRTFYEECDRQGIMVWQDFMTACAEYPGDKDWFVNNIIKEAEYQVKRLRKHPSIVVWCGGNESSNSHNYNPDRPGAKLVHYYLRGVAEDLTKHTAYIASSPHSKSDFGQIENSGETHYSTWPREVGVRYDDFRERNIVSKTVFASEMCCQGPSPLKSIEKWIDKKDIFPFSDTLDFHVKCHIYNDAHSRYLESQLKMTEQLIGEVRNVEEFVNKGMMAHAEMAREELEFQRSRKFIGGGALLWMYNECWPCSNWAIIDYYGYLKPAFYMAMNAFAPLAVCIKKDADSFGVYVMNDTLKDASGTLKITYMNIHGKQHWTKTIKATGTANSSIRVEEIAYRRVTKPNSFIHAEWNTGHRKLSAHYFPQVWKEIPFEKADFSYTTLKKNIKTKQGYSTILRITSRNYSRFIYIEIPGIDVRAVTLSDNYFDLIPGETRNVTITTRVKIKKMHIKSLQNSSM